MKFSVLTIQLFAVHLLLSLRSVSCRTCQALSNLDEADDSVFVKRHDESLSAIPVDIPRNVTHLDLSLNALSSLRTGSFQQFPNLRSLDLSGNMLSNLPSKLFAGVSNLSCLDMSGNSLQEVQPEALEDLVSLETLLLAKNNLSTWDFASLISSASRLAHLDLSDNNILNILSNNQTFTALKTLNLSLNQLRTMKRGWIDELTALEEIYLRENQISSITPGLFLFFANLTKLDLSNNEIEEFNNGSCHGLSRLTELNISENPLTSVPKICLQELKRLRSLYINFNRFSTLPSRSFEGVPSITYLELSNSGLLETVEIGAFDSLTNLKELRLTHNGKLGKITEDMFGSSITSLERLILDSNTLLRTIPESLVRNLMNIRELSLNNLKFRCDCQVRWLREELNRRTTLTFQLFNTTCQGHHSLGNVLFSEVSSSEMVCEIPWVISSAAFTHPPGSASIQITISNTGLPSIEWDLPNGTRLEDPGIYYPTGDNSTLVVIGSTIKPPVLICWLNITNVTAMLYGEYTLTATNMAGNVTHTIVLEKFSTQGLALQTQLLISLVTVVAFLCFVAMVCVINIHHTNCDLATKESLLPTESSARVEEKARDATDISSSECASIVLETVPLDDKAKVNPSYEPGEDEITPM